MNVDDIVRDALREQAAEQLPAAGGFADRVLAVRRRRRNRRAAAGAVAAVVAVAVGVGVPLLDSGKEDVRPSGGIVTPKKVESHPDQSPPRDEISVGGTTLAAYFIPETVKKTADTAVYERTYHLLNPKTGKYTEAADWSWVAVAPGARTAAVLERDLPASRIGMLDLATGKVERWIPVDHGVGGLAFSRDGRKLVATTYTKNPDLRIRTQDADDWVQERRSSRTGFYVLDVASGKGAWNEVKLASDDGEFGAGFLNSRQDFALTDDGRHIWAGNPMQDIGKEFWDLKGVKAPTPANDKHSEWFVVAGKSPNGKLVAGDFAGGKWKTSSWVRDAMTGARTEVRGQQLLAWVGDKQLIAWDIGKNDKNEFHQRLVLVTIGSAKEVPLSGFRAGNDGDAGRWEPVFAQP
ncbi:WD40 repeat domain-containing protein [Streptomyces sp. NPDC006335]|uniref:WD40 repeat domain-containing protein n=1 Tax=Streptomyces sp. NPDC006335 TaxID=3156895 RepID=UPI0033B1EC01